MDATVKAMVQKIYAHQIEGVMFHTLVSNTYAMLGDYKKMVKKHNAQALEELKNHLCFSDYINCKHKEAIQPSATAKPTILAKEVTERPISKLERDLTHKNLMMSWEKWEEETEALYDEALKLMPDCEMLKKLKIEVEKEIKNVISMLNKWK